MAVEVYLRQELIQEGIALLQEAGDQEYLVEFQKALEVREFLLRAGVTPDGKHD